MRKNLFRNAGDTVITVVAGPAILFLIYRLFRFVFVTGRWEILRKNLASLINGNWPEDQLWRLSVILLVLALIGGVASGLAAQSRRNDPSRPPEPSTLQGKALDLASRLWPLGIAVATLLSLTETVGPLLLTIGLVAAVIVGRFVGLYLPLRFKTPWLVGILMVGLGSVWFLNAGVSWNTWDGLLINVFLALVSITLCFPLGVMLALGRRSTLPIVRVLSTGFIEFFRGVPLFALLLMSHVALGYFVPQESAPDRVVRAIVVFVLFTSAYVAEIVRGGLQSIPRGQIEAGRANGLTPTAVVFRIVLPQAIRNVIPALVGQFISLFKDTTLAGAAMGFGELLATTDVITKQPDFVGQGLVVETLMFVLLLFWAGSYTMSRESQRLETGFGTSQR